MVDSAKNFDGLYLKANANSEFNEIEILANTPGLEYLRYLISQLIESSIDGKHFHLDQTGGLGGNISQLIITKKFPE